MKFEVEVEKAELLIKALAKMQELKMLLEQHGINKLRPQFYEFYQAIFDYLLDEIDDQLKAKINVLISQEIGE